MQAALAAGVEPSFAATVVARGIDTCLDEKLDYEVWLYVHSGIRIGLDGTGVSYSYLAPTGAYKSPGKNGEVIFDKPADEKEVCVEDCITPEPRGGDKPPECVSNCL
jgi:hypothetical protein